MADAATSAVVAVRSVAARRKLLSFCFPDLDPFLSVEILPLKRLTATRLAPCGDRLQITRYHNQWDQKKFIRFVLILERRSFDAKVFY